MHDYCPDEEGCHVVDEERLDQLVGDPGPVNFGDLSCTHVERRGKVYVAYVSEAAPDADGLKRYLEKWLQRWGWPVVVQTEWYPWFSQIKGVGMENIAKVLGPIDIYRAPYVSSLWKFAGYAPENGKAARRVKGKKNDFNWRLRTMCWRLGTAMLKAGLRNRCRRCGKIIGEKKRKEHELTCGGELVPEAHSHYAQYYLEAKAQEIEKLTRQGYAIVPSTSLPTRNGKKYEPEGVISEGHVHNRALRKMIKLFLAHLWEVWREAEGLPVRPPYAQAVLDHSHYLDPWEFVDR